ncbi:hypothetical protein Vadar_028910 [Vaccinium darrowii]|uniref:Uncharacterized protein n=1 Tax=Vaccinium darrowii TaxID=229202 RepID=A0ACB7XU04_9ERIC|nr:hypothetical protein Vadar_028910 [Vaccinium darrowii]
MGASSDPTKNGNSDEQQCRSKIYESPWHIYAMNWSVWHDKAVLQSRMGEGGWYEIWALFPEIGRSLGSGMGIEMDISECEDHNLNDCDKVNGICRNTPGSYSCSCNSHYYGDGKSCTKKASQFPVIKFSLEAIKKEQAVDAKVAETIAKHKEELDQVDSSAYQAGQNKAAKYYATGQGLDAAQVQRDVPIRQIPKAPIPDVPISPSAEEEPTEESTEHVEDESKPPAAT